MTRVIRLRIWLPLVASILCYDLPVRAESNLTVIEHDDPSSGEIDTLLAQEGQPVPSDPDESDSLRILITGEENLTFLLGGCSL